MRPRSIPYDPKKSFEPIGRFTQSHQVLVAKKNFPVDNIAQLISYLKKNPNKVTYGTPGIGTNQQVSMETLQIMTGTKMVHVPYTSSTRVATDLVGGQIDLAIDQVPQLLPYIQSGKLKVLGYTGGTRPAFDQTIPTIGETVPGFIVTGWHGFFAPAGTPKKIVDQLSDAIRQFMAQRDTIARFESLGTTAASTTAEETGKFLLNDIERTRPILSKAGMIEE